MNLITSNPQHSGKTFNKLRKIQNEFRNLNMHLVCVALRLQDLSAKIRSKMSIIVSRVSLDDFQLKIRNPLRNSKFRKDITTLEKGKFVFPQTDQILEVQPFKQKGKPYEIMKPKPKVKQQPKKEGITQKIRNFLIASGFLTPKLEGKGEPLEEEEPSEMEDEEMEEDLALLGEPDEEW